MTGQADKTWELSYKFWLFTNTIRKPREKMPEIALVERISAAITYLVAQKSYKFAIVSEVA